MLDVLNLTIPMFSLIGIGLILKKTNFITEENGKILSKFAFYILLPPLMFSSILAGNASNSLSLNFVVRYEIVTIFIFFITFLLGSLFNLRVMEKGIFGLNAAYPNYGYIGVPLCILAFGIEAAVPLALILLADTFVLLSTLILYSIAQNKHTNLQLLGREILARFFYNPLMLSVIFAFFFSFLKIDIYTPIDTTISLIASSATAVALIALGISLNIKSVSEKKTIILLITVIKLMLHPILIFFIFFYSENINPIWVKTAIVCASLPVAANVFVLASYYKTFSNESAAAITLTTIFSSITVTITLLQIL